MANITTSPTNSTINSVACGGTDTVTGAKTSPTNASTSTRYIRAEDLPEQRQRGQAREHAFKRRTPTAQLQRGDAGQGMAAPRGHAALAAFPDPEFLRRARPNGHVEHAEQPLPAARQRDSGDIAGTDPDERLADGRCERYLTTTRVRGAPSDQCELHRLARLVGDSDGRSQAGRPVGIVAGGDDRSGPREPLELRDSRLVDGGILEYSEAVVVIPGASEVPGVAKPPGQLAAVSTAQFVELSHELGVVRRAELHPCRQRRRHG